MSIPSLSLDNKVAIVTGGRRGIGKTIALGFAEAGANLVICDLAVEDGELEATAKEIEQLGRRCLAIEADVSKKANVENLVKQTITELGGLDILVNNAGINIRGSILETREENWDKVIDVNLKSCYLCCQEVGRVMVERKSGSIINIASSAGIRPLPNSIAYNVSKAGLIMLTKESAMELGSYNIRVNAIAPWVISTKLTEGLRSNPERTQYALAETPMGRLGETSDLVGVALFLASDASPWMSGDIIVVDGGYLAGDFGMG